MSQRRATHRTRRRRAIARVALTLAGLTLVLGLPLCARASASTTFRAQFVCNDRGAVYPLAGVHVDFIKRAHDDLPIWSSTDVLRSLITDEEGRVGVQVTGPEADFLFRVWLVSEEPYLNAPYTHRDVFAGNWWAGPPVRVLSDQWRGWAYSQDTGTNQNDVAVQDYGTQVLGDGRSTPECAVFEGARRAYYDYHRLISPESRLLPELHLSLNAFITTGGPWSRVDDMAWPAGYPPGPKPGTFSSSFSEYGRTIYHRLVDSAYETTFAEGNRPCKRRDDLVQAFVEGWGQYWSGAWAPAPKCDGIPADDYHASGNVAAALAGLDTFCPGVGRREMVGVLEQHSGAIYSFNDFRKALGCSGLIDAVTSPVHPDGTLAMRTTNQFAKKEIAALARSAESLRERIGKAEAAAKNAPCPPKPCDGSLVRVVRSFLLRAELAQVNGVRKTLLVGTSAKKLRRLAHGSIKRLNRALLHRAAKFRRSYLDAAAVQLRRALDAAAPILAKDKSTVTAKLVARLRQVRKKFNAGRAPVGFLIGTPGGPRLHRGKPWTPPPRPDLVVDSITGFENSSSPALHVTIRNGGNATAPASKLLLHSRSDPNDFDADHVFDVPALGPGASVTVDASCDNTHAAYAADSATATADSAHAIAESNESNNARSETSGSFCVFT